MAYHAAAIPAAGVRTARRAARRHPSRRTVADTAPTRSAGTRRGLWIVLALALLVRLFDLGGPLEDPHAWRQCDTVDASRTFARSGIDLLHPKVSWLGGHGTLIFEFPLPEAAAALLHRAFGFSPAWDRLVAFASFLLALYFFSRWVRDMAGANVAAVATMFYATAPLATFFSRAPTIDFTATAFAHGLLWFGARAARHGRLGDLIAASCCGALAAMVKGPYVLPIACVLAAQTLGVPDRRVSRAAIALAATAVAFVLWRRWVNAVNGAAPDWTWLPGYYKEVNPWWWYVGSPGERF